MKPSDFPESTKTLQRPSDMTDDECGPLRIWNDDHTTCVSLWKPTLRERLSILIFGHVWLRVHSGQTMPPVLIEGRQTIFKRLK